MAEGLKTGSGAPRKNLPTGVLVTRATALRPTTLFDLLYRLILRSNYEEGDALLSGALGPRDAGNFHDALCDIDRAHRATRKRRGQSARVTAPVSPRHRYTTEAAVPRVSRRRGRRSHDPGTYRKERTERRQGA